MRKNKKQKRRFHCIDNVNQTNRSKRRRLEEGPLFDAFDTKESKLKKLPSNCLRHILSFVTFEKVSQMRQVCTAFNEIGKKLLAKGQRELESRLKGEIERAERRVLCPTNVRSSYEMIRFLKDLHDVIYGCTIAYKYHRDYFVAGKLLDEGNCLLKDFNSSTTVPYFLEDVYNQKTHSFLGPILALSERAQEHFGTEISKKFMYYDLEAAVAGIQQNDVDVALLNEQYIERKVKTNLLKNRRRRINCGHEMSGEFIKLIVKLNESVLDLIQRVKKVDEEVERVISGRDSLDNKKSLSNDYLSQLSSKLLLVGIQVGPKRSNLATLPSYCIRRIVSNFDCAKMAQMRTICKSFNEACEKELNGEFENVKRKLEFQIKYYEKRDTRFTLKTYALRTRIMRDLCSFLQLCKDNYKRHLGSNYYYFAAGKVVDEVNHIIYTNWDNIYGIFYDVDKDYTFQPHYILFHLMDVVYKTFDHFKFDIVPRYLPSTQNPTYVPDFLISGVVINLENESRANIKEIEMLIEEAGVKINEQNNRNRKLLKIISGLRKKVFILNKEAQYNIIKLMY